MITIYPPSLTAVSSNLLTLNVFHLMCIETHFVASPAVPCVAYASKPALAARSAHLNTTVVVSCDPRGMLSVTPGNNNCVPGNILQIHNSKF